MNDYLYDNEFLKQLNKYHTKVNYARITALSWEENPLERIEGKITAGTVNIDGNSAIQRTCSLTMVSNDVNIQDYYWGLCNKFKLEIGLENKINSNYPDIVWFPQGIFVITGFNTSYTVNNCTITIQGKDKMCLLNGDMGGSLPSQIDFGIEEYYDVDDQVTYYNPIPLKTIIHNAVNVYGNEPLHNIIINDLDMIGLEQIRYRGDAPLYLIRDESDGIYTNMTLKGNMQCIKVGNEQSTTLNNLKYNIDIPALTTDTKGDIVTFPNLQDNTKKYTVFKAEYGDEVGYRPTELTYAGELIANVGESLTSVLDKIKNMLGNYEYFYDIDGRFIFQKKQTYINSPWTSLKKEGNDVYAMDAVYTSASVYNFNDLGYFTAITHNPTFNNLKNDFSIWGVRKGITGQDLPVHLRYALDKKPIYYRNYLGDIYITKNYIEYLPDGTIITIDDLDSEKTYIVDWREIIYQMAVDYYNHHDEEDFLYQVQQKNYQNTLNRYPSGRTGYEAYYVDIYSFWRELYDLRIVKADFIDMNKTYYYKDEDGVYDIATKDNNKIQLKTVDELKSVQVYKLVAGEYSAITIENVNDIPEESYKDYYIKNEYKLLGLREYENYINQHEKYNKANTNEEREKYQYYYYKNNQYNACFGGANNIEWDKNRAYYKKDVEEYIPCSFYKIATNEILYYPNNVNYDINTGWNTVVNETPENLNFWFDFIGEGSSMDKYLACNIGHRMKSLNDNDVTGIYFEEVPNILYITANDFELLFNSEQDQTTGYTQVRVNDGLAGLFAISSQGKSAYNVLEKLLEENTYCIENITITSIPIYYLKPNVRIEVSDKESGVEGEYLISKITLPLTYNGTMSITATKAMDTIY